MEFQRLLHDDGRYLTASTIFAGSRSLIFRLEGAVSIEEENRAAVEVAEE